MDTIADVSKRIDRIIALRKDNPYHSKNINLLWNPLQTVPFVFLSSDSLCKLFGKIVLQKCFSNFDIEWEDYR